MTTNRLVLNPIRKTPIEPPQVMAVKGTEVTCPGCKATIGWLTRDIYQGLNPGPELLRFHPKQTRHANQPTTCTRCGEGYWKFVMGGELRGKFTVHTKAAGWVS